jgi:hypothetical protein
MNTSYRSSSRDYIKRAQQLLKSGNSESLFYAAFELRCGIEARMQEYLEVADDISEKKKQGWKIAELGKNLERAFKLGNKIVQLNFEDAVSSNQCTIYHTPVNSQLRKQGQQLGNYLHAMKGHRKLDDPWWKVFKSLLDETCNGLSIATKGTLLGPPLFQPDGRTVKTHHELEVEPMVDEAMKKIGRVGGHIRLRVEYLADLPPENK